MRRALWSSAYHAYRLLLGVGGVRGERIRVMCMLYECVCVMCCSVVFYVRDPRRVNVSFLNVSAVFASMMCWGRLFQSRMVRGKYEFL